MPKCDFDKVAKQLYWNHTSAWMFSCKFAVYFQNICYWEHLWTAASEYNAFSLSNKPASLTIPFTSFWIHACILFKHSDFVWVFNGTAVLQNFTRFAGKSLNWVVLSKVNLLRCQTLIIIFCPSFASTSVHFRCDFCHVGHVNNQKIGHGPFKTWKSLSKNWHFNILNIQSIAGVLRWILRSFFRDAIWQNTDGQLLPALCHIWLS